MATRGWRSPEGWSAFAAIFSAATAFIAWQTSQEALEEAKRTAAFTADRVRFERRLDMIEMFSDFAARSRIIGATAATTERKLRVEASSVEDEALKLSILDELSSVVKTVSDASFENAERADSTLSRLQNISDFDLSFLEEIALLSGGFSSSIAISQTNLDMAAFIARDRISNALSAQKQ